jgi:hypothetical protein
VRQAEKQAELEPYIAAALARKVRMQALKDDDIPTYVSLGRRISEESKNEPSIYESPAAVQD